METTIRSYSGELSPPSVAFVASVAVRHSSISVEADAFVPNLGQM